MSAAAPAAGDPIPAALTLSELAEQLRLSVRQVNRHRQRRDHPAIKQLDQPGHPRFCGLTVKRWREAQQHGEQRTARFGRVLRKSEGETIRERAIR